MFSGEKQPITTFFQSLWGVARENLRTSNLPHVQRMWGRFLIGRRAKKIYTTSKVDVNN